jgi:hypothetical protein
MDLTIGLHSLLSNTKLRLKNEHGWDEDFINSAINEYAKFIYLHQKYSEGKLVPGKVVDLVWHDHILHTRDYIAFCEKYLGGYLHHDPKNLVSGEVNDPEFTQKSYLESFGYPAPKIFWGHELPKATISEQKPVVKPKEQAATKSTGPSCCRCG